MLDQIIRQLTMKVTQLSVTQISKQLTHIILEINNPTLWFNWFGNQTSNQIQQGPAYTEIKLEKNNNNKLSIFHFPILWNYYSSSVTLINSLII